jgi:hypothetical protein
MAPITKHPGSVALGFACAGALGLVACTTQVDPSVVSRASRPDAGFFTSGTVDTVGSSTTGLGGFGGAGGTNDPGTGGSPADAVRGIDGRAATTAPS